MTNSYANVDRRRVGITYLPVRLQLHLGSHPSLGCFKARVKKQPARILYIWGCCCCQWGCMCHIMESETCRPTPKLTSRSPF